MVTDISFFGSKDDRYFLSGSLDGKIRLWNIPDKKVTMWNELSGSSNLITTANFCHNGRLAVVGTYDGRCIFYTTDVSRAVAGSDNLAVSFCMSLSLVLLPISINVCSILIRPDKGMAASVWGLLMCALVLMPVITHKGCTDAVRESAHQLHTMDRIDSTFTLLDTVH